MRRLNFFLGANNIGKSSILEAIFTHASSLNLGRIIPILLKKRQGLRRITQPFDYGERIFNLFNSYKEHHFTFKICAKLHDSSMDYELITSFRPSKELTTIFFDDLIIQYQGLIGVRKDRKIFSNHFESVDIDIDYDEELEFFVGNWIVKLNDTQKEEELSLPYDNPFNTPSLNFKQVSMHDILSHRNSDDVRVFGILMRADVFDQFLSDIRAIFPIKNIQFIPYSSNLRTPIYVELINGTKLPMYSFGDGFRRLFTILGYMVVNQRAVHCIDEIDVSFHPGSQPEFAASLCKYAEKYNNQLFMTTHNIEFMDSFLEALYGKESEFNFDESTDPVSIYTLFDDEGILKHRTLSGIEAYRSREKFKLELR